MNEEEKKAIEYFKDLDISFNTLLRIDLNGFRNAIQLVLNLIEKQQKEIKARLEEIDSLYKMMSAKDDIINFKDDEIKYLEGKLEQYVDTPEFEEKYISKDKIKDKIEEITSYSYTSAEERDCQDYAIQVLKELLGE